MEWLITNSIAAWLLPPGFLLLALLAALLLGWRRPRLARGLLALTLVSFYALSTAVVSGQLRLWLEPAPRDPLSDESGGAIVVLGGGIHADAPEYGADAPSQETLVRLRYGARLHHALRKPVLVTGGTVRQGTPEAITMKTVLEREFHVPVKWMEQRSKNTLENARLSRAVLEAAGIRRVYLVTHAWHMRRSRLAFEHYGFNVIPAGTSYARRTQLTLLHFLPSAGALLESSFVFHEVIGIGWYHLRFLVGR